MIHLYTGDGKGKTTAAVGLAVRAAGRNMKVCFSQFMKGSDTGEIHVLKNLSRITILRSEKDFGFYSQMSQEDKAELTVIHNGILDELLRRAESGECDMLILDEVTYPVNWGLLDRDKLVRLLEYGEDAEIVITGRDPEDFLKDCADYITEMKALRHPYEKGITARRGIEY